MLCTAAALLVHGAYVPSLARASRDISSSTFTPTTLARLSRIANRNAGLTPRCCAADDAPVRKMSGDDHILGATSADGSISAKAMVTTTLVSEATQLQGLGGLAAAALGRCLTCTLLIADGTEEDETFQVCFAQGRSSCGGRLEAEAGDMKGDGEEAGTGAGTGAGQR